MFSSKITSTQIENTIAFAHEIGEAYEVDLFGPEGRLIAHTIASVLTYQGLINKQFNFELLLEEYGDSEYMQTNMHSQQRVIEKNIQSNKYPDIFCKNGYISNIALHQVYPIMQFIHDGYNDIADTLILYNKQAAPFVGEVLLQKKIHENLNMNDHSKCAIFSTAELHDDTYRDPGVVTIGQFKEIIEKNKAYPFWSYTFPSKNPFQTMLPYVSSDHGIVVVGWVLGT